MRTTSWPSCHALQGRSSRGRCVPFITRPPLCDRKKEDIAASRRYSGSRDTDAPSILQCRQFSRSRLKGTYWRLSASSPLSLLRFRRSLRTRCGQGLIGEVNPTIIPLDVAARHGARGVDFIPPLALGQHISQPGLIHACCTAHTHPCAHPSHPPALTGADAPAPGRCGRPCGGGVRAAAAGARGWVPLILPLCSALHPAAALQGTHDLQTQPTSHSRCSAPGCAV